MRIVMAIWDPFLHPWDEQFHALVARNMMDQPFVPRLIKGAAQAGFKEWCCNDIWLHKQPLFLWQMAASMKIFGVSEFALRLPSIIMGTLMVPLTYLLARLQSFQFSTAFIAAVGVAFSINFLELTSGFEGMDHNDMAFSFYILFSFYFYARYNHGRKWKWIVMTGLAVGAAVLCKWLTGMVVFSGWGLSMLLYTKPHQWLRESARLAIAVLVAVVVAAPWQLYIFYRWPAIAAHEMKYNTLHFSQSVEGHGGTWRYYFDRFPEYFGPAIWILVPIGSLVLISRMKNGPKNLLLCFLLVFSSSCSIQ